MTRLDNNLLIVGAAGFIGSNFARYIAHQHPDYSLLCIDKLTPYSELASIRDLIESGRISFEQLDISLEHEVERLFNRYSFEGIVNFAAESHNDRAIINPRPFINSNVVGAYNLLEAARVHQVERFVHISTIEVYGEQAPDVQFFTEASPINAKTPYSASKAAADIIIRSYMQTYPDFNVSLTHCANNYGPYQFPEKLIPLAITEVLQGRKVSLYGDGSQRRDWLHVLDHCRGIELVLYRGRSGFSAEEASIDPCKLPIYDFSARQEMTNVQIIKIVLDTLGLNFEDWVEFVEDRPNHDRRYLINPAKAEAELGFRPQIDIMQGIKQTVEWYVENRYWWESIVARAPNLRFDWATLRPSHPNTGI